MLIYKDNQDNTGITVLYFDILFLGVNFFFMCHDVNNSI